VICYTEIYIMGVDIGLTCIFQASGGTSTCLKYLGYVESTKVFVTEQVHGIYIYICIYTGWSV
jgi:hypothetical protein